MLSEHLSFVLSRLKLAVYNDPSDFIFLKYTNTQYRHLRNRTLRLNVVFTPQFKRVEGRKRIGKGEKKNNNPQTKRKKRNILNEKSGSTNKWPVY